ncbi:MAG: phospholipase [Gemmatimonadota bacterium]
MTPPSREIELRVLRTARCVVLGSAAEPHSRCWYVLHGYGQLARQFAGSAALLVEGGGMLVAPEALSRFYRATAEVASHGAAPVGASWMTREGRDAEIADYVEYLDAVHRAVGAAGGDVAVLGFSQGAATAARWATLGAIRPRHLVLWGGVEPDDLDDAARARLAGVRVTYVHGTRDRIADAEEMIRRADALTAAGGRAEVIKFDGGHRLDDGILSRLAAT